MADKKQLSQAQKAVSATKQKKTAAGKNSAGKKTEQDGKKPVAEAVSEPAIPVRFITAVVCLGLFVLFLVIAFNPEGALITFLGDILMGLIGKTGFLVAIPVLLYLFYIQAFSGKRPVLGRSLSLIGFIFLCGCIAHLWADAMYLPADISILGELYLGGATGATGGVLCGSVAVIVKWLCGQVISYIIFILGAVLTLLGGMQITIPGIIRAVRNRPRADWELEEIDEEEPAAKVVNTIAKKRIEYVEQKRHQRALKAEANVVNTDASDDLIRQIDADVQAPVAAAGSVVVATDDESDFLVPEVEDATPAVTPKPEVIPAAAIAPKKASVKAVPAAEPVPVEMPEYDPEEDVLPPVLPDPAALEAVAKQKVTAKDAEESAALVAAEIAQAAEEPKPVYVYPPIDLLKLPGRSAADGTAEMKENSRRLNETLASFKIEAHIVNVTRGPSVTRYEVELEKGVRLNKLTTCADDIALSLGASGVRIAAVPDKISVVGIEVPNKAVTTVSLREVIDSADFAKAKSKSSFAVGKDIGGKCIVGNIAKLPHMLIAGTTGSGKSVCMNSIIISLLYKASPEDVKLIMVDPKMVELGIYNGIPHLLIPVVTDPKKAAGSLQWAVTEMMRRYKAMSDAGVRDLESYNGMVESGEIEGEKLPQVVVIIDELADLMLVAAKEVEESICRIAQMGRASGIHLVIATQRPSADVITGLMKANIPSRIAFAVASAMESRIILDTQGAEKLVGRGDMLFAPIGTGKPQRVQGCFVSDPEVEAVANFVKNNFTTNYDQSVMEEIERKAAQTGNPKAAAAAADPEPNAEELDGDEMLPQAVDVILETGQASVSMLQRRLKLGYARAARIVDEMEEKGIVGPFQGSKPRSILITKEQWEAMKGGQPTQMDFDDLADAPVPEEIL